MCDFKAGDEVVCVDADLAWGVVPHGLVMGTTYRVLAVAYNRTTTDGGNVSIQVEVRSPHPEGLWRSSRFRKVQKRDSSLSISDFLTIKPGQFEEPRRVSEPVKRRERA